MAQPPGDLSEFGDEHRVPGEVNGLRPRAQDEGDLVDAMLGGGRGDGDPAEFDPLPGGQGRDVGEAMSAGGSDDGLGDEQRDRVVAVGGKGFEVAVIVVFVADQHTVEPRQVGHGEGDRLALVVAGPGAEPGVCQEGAAADLYQVAAVRDAGYRGLGHDRISSVR